MRHRRPRPSDQQRPPPWRETRGRWIGGSRRSRPSRWSGTVPTGSLFGTISSGSAASGGGGKHRSTAPPGLWHSSGPRGILEPMNRWLARFAPIALALIVLAAPAGAQTSAEIEIPFERFVLSNGLTLIVHEDHKAPIVAVNVWYHVGSKNERPGKTGFAHLFEHLMFNGSENFNDEWFKAMARVGATDLNGTTNTDRTNYFQNVPVEALDLVLWMESDRMGHLLGAIDEAQLDEQRGVVQNEKRQGENQPYGVTRQLLAENTYPEGHPYHWTTIGSMEDLDAASLEDVQEWFKTYYG